MSRPHDVPVELVPVDAHVLDELVRAATAGASADEVTPPVTPGGGWTDAPAQWLTAQADGPAVRAELALEVDGQGSESQARPSPSASSRATSP